MPELLEFVPQSGERYTAKLSDGSEIKTTLNVMTELRLYKGQELSEDEAENFRSASLSALCFDHAIRLLNYGSLSRRDMIFKLTHKGETPENAEAAADKLVELGLINDKALAGMLVRSYSERGYGVGRIKQELIRHGIDRDLWEGLFEENLPEDNEKLLQLIRKKNIDFEDRKEVGKLCASLARRGFGWSEIQDAVNTVRYEEDYT